MPAAIVARSETAFTIQIEIPYGSSVLESEETIQEHLNQAGVLATPEALQRFAGHATVGRSQAAHTSFRHSPNDSSFLVPSGVVARRG